jgi:hypothetical protein
LFSSADCRALNPISDAPIEHNADLQNGPKQIISVHPVLKTAFYAGFEGKPINPAFFELLNARTHLLILTRQQLSPSRFADCFKLAELEVTQKFCLLAVGRRPDEIEGLAGEPMAKMGKVDCWEDAKTGEKNWLYSFGYQDIPVRVVFRKGHCARAVIIDRDQVGEYVHWRLQLMETFGMVGKTGREIEHFMGDQRSAVNDGTRLQYYILKCNYLEVHLQNGKCVSSKLWALM